VCAQESCDKVEKYLDSGLVYVDFILEDGGAKAVLTSSQKQSSSGSGEICHRDIFKCRDSAFVIQRNTQRRTIGCTTTRAYKLRIQNIQWLPNSPLCVGALKIVGNY